MWEHACFLQCSSFSDVNRKLQTLDVMSTNWSKMSTFLRYQISYDSMECESIQWGGGQGSTCLEDKSKTLYSLIEEKQLGNSV